MAVIWVMFAAWAATLPTRRTLRHHAARWKGIASEWEAQSKRWEQIANRHKYTAEMWAHMYEGERDHV